MAATLPTVLAYYGKLPARGDFVGRRLDRETVAAWDDWLQRAIAESRAAIGAAWLERYFVSPLWRFVLPPGLCGGAGLAGVMMPSVDKVGRAFPLMLAAAAPTDLAPAALVAGGGAWFAAVEDLALAALADDFALDRLDQPIGVDRLGPGPGGTAVATPNLGPVGHCAPLAGPDDAPALAAPGDDRSLWWTTGAEHVAPVLVQARGLPAPAGFAAFIDGDWAGRGWSVAAGPDPAGAAVGSSGAFAPMEADLAAWDREE